jgi:hypothetical protein
MSLRKRSSGTRIWTVTGVRARRIKMLAITTASMLVTYPHCSHPASHGGAPHSRLATPPDPSSPCGPKSFSNSYIVKRDEGSMSIKVMCRKNGTPLFWPDVEATRNTRHLHHIFPRGHQCDGCWPPGQNRTNRVLVPAKLAQTCRVHRTSSWPFGLFSLWVDM